MATKEKKKENTENNKRLVRMWRNWNPCALLVRMQNSAASMENRMTILKKMENRIVR